MENIKMSAGGEVGLSQSGRMILSLRRFLSYAAVAFVNVLVLLFFAAYFGNQRLDLVDAIGIVGDSIGIVTGLLGIWFFFLSEQLNRGTSINLERTTGLVEDLRTQMWEMIRETFTALTAREQLEETKEMRELLRRVGEEVVTETDEGEVRTQVENLLNLMAQRVDELESRVQWFSSPKPSYTSSRPRRNINLLILEVKRIFDAQQESKPLSHHDLKRQLPPSLSPGEFGFGSWGEAFHYLEDLGYLRRSDNRYEIGPNLHGPDRS